MRAFMLQRQRLVVAVLAAMLATVVATPALAVAGTDQGPRAVDPIAQQARYQTLTAEWWQWAFSTPVETGGPFDAGAVRCAVNQAGSDVLFLAAPFNASGTVDRTCTDPVRRATRGAPRRGREFFFLARRFNAGARVERPSPNPGRRATQLFSPVINTECPNADPPPFFGARPKPRRDCVKKDPFAPADLSATV